MKIGYQSVNDTKGKTRGDEDIGFAPVWHHLALRIHGTFQQPQARGSLGLSDGELQLASIGERYREMQSEIVFSGRRVDIRRLEIGSRSDTANLSGWLEMNGLDDFRAELLANLVEEEGGRLEPG